MSLLVAAGCQSSEPNAELVSRLDAIDQRLGEVETKLQTVVDWTTAKAEAEAKAKAEHEARVKAMEAERAEREAEREAKRAEREALRAERRAGLFGELGPRRDPDDPLADPGEARPSSREIEGAAEAVLCTEPAPGRIDCTIERAFIDTLLANPALLAKQARVVPRMRDGDYDGFKLYGIRSGSLPKLLGMKNGDAIIEINGTPLGAMDEVLELYTSLRKETRFLVELERKGLPVALTIEIVK